MQGVQDRMKTGLMFDMIIKMFIKENAALIENQNSLLGIEIYKNSDRQELELIWNLHVIVISHSLKIISCQYERYII